MMNTTEMMRSTNRNAMNRDQFSRARLISRSSSRRRCSISDSMRQRRTSSGESRPRCSGSEPRRPGEDAGLIGRCCRGSIPSLVGSLRWTKRADPLYRYEPRASRRRLPLAARANAAPRSSDSNAITAGELIEAPVAASPPPLAGLGVGVAAPEPGVGDGVTAAAMLKLNTALARDPFSVRV